MTSATCVAPEDIAERLEGTSLALAPTRSYGGRMRFRGAVSAAICAATVLLIPPAAQAKSPPKGTYECVIGANTQLFEPFAQIVRSRD